MTWETLERWVSGIAGAPALAQDRLGDAVRALEDLADRDPADRGIAAAVRAACDAHCARAELPAEIGGIRPERLLSWTGWDSTWLGVDVATGREAVLRVLRADHRDPVRVRAMRRDAVALEDLAPGVRSGDGWIAAAAPGLPLGGPPTADPVRLSRLVGSAVAALQRFEATGQQPVLAPAQWRVVGDVVVLSAVETRAAGDAGAALAWLAGRLTPEGEPEWAIHELLGGFSHAPPRTAEVAAELVVHALATDLAARRHALHHRRRATAHGDRVARLLDLTRRLERALAPPSAVAPAGVDPDGRPAVVRSGAQGVWWGPEGAAAPVWTPSAGFDAAHARRFLRARAAAGATEDSAAVGRWVAAGLKLRTIRLLLERA